MSTGCPRIARAVKCSLNVVPWTWVIAMAKSQGSGSRGGPAFRKAATAEMVCGIRANPRNHRQRYSASPDVHLVLLIATVWPDASLAAYTQPNDPLAMVLTSGFSIPRGNRHWEILHLITRSHSVSLVSLGGFHLLDCMEGLAQAVNLQ